jgi:hypothetical protein
MEPKVLTEEDDVQWEALCRAEYAAFRKRNPVPFLPHFWSASAWFYCWEDWRRAWHRHIESVGDAFWKERGYVVVNWNVPANEPIQTAPCKPSGAQGI